MDFDGGKCSLYSSGTRLDKFSSRDQSKYDWSKIFQMWVLQRCGFWVHGSAENGFKYRVQLPETAKFSILSEIIAILLLLLA